MWFRNSILPVICTNQLGTYFRVNVIFYSSAVLFVRIRKEPRRLNQCKILLTVYIPWNATVKCRIIADNCLVGITIQLLVSTLVGIFIRSRKTTNYIYHTIHNYAIARNILLYSLTQCI